MGYLLLLRLFIMDLFIIISVSSRFGLKILVMVLISYLSIYLYLHLLGSVEFTPFYCTLQEPVHGYSPGRAMERGKARK